ncbi:MAG: hypothetical protein ACQES4_11670 [Bacillota bacterium]
MNYNKPEYNSIIIRANLYNKPLVLLTLMVIDPARDYLREGLLAIE